MRRFWIMLCVLTVMSVPLAAQEATPEPPPPTVPDVVGLSVPEAAALLNAAGLNLGEEVIQITNDDTAVERGITEQSVAAGTTAERGSAVNVTVLRSNNIVLIYDDNDITMVNQSPAGLDLTRVAFTAAEIRFNANRWGNTALDAADCTQLWSVGRGTPKSINECGAIQRWLTTNNADEHFWTAANTDGTFSVVQSGIVRENCPTATVAGQVLECAFFMATGDTNEVTEFVYLVYTPTQLLIRNIADDLWMPIAGITLEGADDDVATSLVAERFDAPIEIGDADRLAPGQCLYYTTPDATDSAPPEDCTVIGQATLPDAWVAGFDLMGMTRTDPSTCPPAIAGRLTVCIAPR